MERRDYLLQQIQMMGLFLQKLIARMLKREENEGTDEIHDMVRSEINKELNLDIDEMILLRDEDFFSILKEKKFTDSHLEQLGQILYMLGKPDDITISLGKRNYLQKSLAIYNEIEMQSRSFSMERNERIMEIKQLLN